jgi:hypothetical protein
MQQRAAFGGAARPASRALAASRAGSAARTLGRTRPMAGRLQANDLPKPTLGTFDDEVKEQSRKYRRTVRFERRWRAARAAPRRGTRMCVRRRVQPGNRARGLAVAPRVGDWGGVVALGRAGRARYRACGGGRAAPRRRRSLPRNARRANQLRRLARRPRARARALWGLLSDADTQLGRRGRAVFGNPPRPRASAAAQSASIAGRPSIADAHTSPSPPQKRCLAWTSG